MDFAERSQVMWAGIVAFLPSLFGAILILLIGLVIAKLLEKGTDALLERLHFDEALDRGGVNRTLARAGTKLDPSSLVARLVFWTVALVAILMASNALGLTAVSAMFYTLISYIPRVIVALALFMALDQLQVAPDIVRTAFTLLLGAAALAAGLAFGLGCRDLAGEHMRRWVEQGQRKAEEVRQARLEAEQRPGGPYRPGVPQPVSGMAASRLDGDSTIALPPSPVSRPPL
ncbi:MAG: hypothetical protein DMF53_14880 [Acidobacteria bacterium]|nr:MAG: hypothetical protein DMF53_14880 [Acidobacteriota bacterium]